MRRVLDMNAVIDRVGQIYGRLTVYSRAANKHNGNSVWNCVCACGNEVEVQGIDLGKNTNSCGCLKSETVRSRRVIDDRTKHPLYKTWINMINRCHNPKATQFNDYGGRMIFVSYAWRESFFQFVEDMGPKPSENHTLDRKNNDEGYSKENCKWSTWEEQNNNQRRSAK